MRAIDLADLYDELCAALTPEGTSEREAPTLCVAVRSSATGGDGG